jgi:hypothetical protein
VKSSLAFVTALGLAGLASSGCSLVVYNDATTPAACDDDDACPAGEACIDERCAAVDPGSVPGVGTSVGVAGGTVTGPDGVVLDVPAGALPGNFTITIARTTSTLPRDNVGDGTFYEIEPALAFAIWVSPLEGVTWEALATDDARFVLPRTGVVVRAAETP